jgi:hypothetical protein
MTWKFGDGPLFCRLDWGTGEVAPCSAAEWQSDADRDRRIICQSETAIGLLSTVFLGVEHSGGFFETMLFADDGEMQLMVGRQPTFARACAQHRRSLRAITRAAASVGGDADVFGAAKRLGYDDESWPHWLKGRLF